MLKLNFSPFPILELERLIFRAIRDTDVNEIFALIGFYRTLNKHQTIRIINDLKKIYTWNFTLNPIHLEIKTGKIIRLSRRKWK